MKKLIYCILLLLPIFISSGCKKFLDVNQDPNNPNDVGEALILAPVETTISTCVAGGSFSTQNINGVALITSYWTQQLAVNQPQPEIDGYKLRSDEVDQLWLTAYSTIMQNLKILDRKAQANGNHAYGVIAKVLMAYTLGVTTDMWGDVPYSEAFDGNFKPAYDKQEDIYTTLQQLLDDAIAENQLDPGNAPASDDFIYGGDMENWQKLAYTLKARFYMHLTKAPGHTAAAQAALALTALTNGFSAPGDEASFGAYVAAAGSESPWFVNTLEDQGGVVLSSTLIDSLVSRNDPRLPVIAAKSQSGNAYHGKVNSSDPDPDPNIFSTINSFYAGIDAPVALVTYSEALFLKAEATLITSGAAAATPIYQEAIKSHMTKLGISLASPDAVAYLAARGTLTDANALQRIMEEKSIANFLSIENYNDWRRTGFPILAPVVEPTFPTIPVRFPYPLDEETSNARPEHSATLSTNVWWDQ